jgi:hypothetical protein
VRFFSAARAGLPALLNSDGDLHAACAAILPVGICNSVEFSDFLPKYSQISSLLEEFLHNCHKYTSIFSFFHPQLPKNEILLVNILRNNFFVKLKQFFLARIIGTVWSVKYT